MIVFHLAQGVLVEWVKSLGKWQVTWFPTLIELVFYTIVATAVSYKEVIVLLKKPALHAFFLRQSVAIGVCLALARGLTWVAIFRLSYPMAVLLKSSKLVVVMAGNTLLLQRKHGASEYLKALLMTLGVYLFSIGDTSAEGTFSVVGLGAMVLSLVFDSLMVNLQEAAFRNTEAEVSKESLIAISNFSGSIVMGSLSLAFGEIPAALTDAVAQPKRTGIVAASCVAAYIALQFWLELIKKYGAVEAATVGILRKFIQILLSYLVFPKAITLSHAAGFILFALSFTDVHLWHEYGGWVMRVVSGNKTSKGNVEAKEESGDEKEGGDVTGRKKRRSGVGDEERREGVSRMSEDNVENI